MQPKHDLEMLAQDDLNHPVFDRFSTVAARCGGHIAVFDGAGACSYQQLLGLARRYASLIDRRAPADAPVALCMPPNRHMVAAMLGALAVGRPYVPLDPAYPVAQLARVVDHSGACLVIGHKNQDMTPFSTGREAEDGQGPLLLTASDLDPAAAGPVGRAGPDSPAYIIYTSGSTGAPKGVWQNQRGLLHDVLQYTQMIEPRPKDRLSLLYSPSVNGALRDIYGAVLNGATLCMFHLKQQGIAQVQRQLIARRVTVLHAMPPVLRSLLRMANGPICPDARVLYTAGDRFLASDLSTLRDNLPSGCRIYTGIGSTECATLYRHWFVPPDFTPGSVLVPVGHAIPDRDMRLVDSADQLVPPGEIGQIQVCSPFIAQGYWNNETLTRTCFLPDPARPGWRRFQPGDLGRMRPDGLLEFLGRADRQIKIRGYRVEPAEIETALRGMVGVAEAVVVPRERSGKTDLVAFVEPAQEGGLTAPELTKTLVNGLKTSLAAHLQPSEVRIRSQLPRLQNFKLDIAALKADLAQPAPGNDGSARAGADSTYLALWARVFRRTIGPDQSLDEIGADSLELLELELLLERELNISVRGALQPAATPNSVWHSAAPTAPRHSGSQDAVTEKLHALAALMARSDGLALDVDGLVRLYNHKGQRTPLIWCFNQVEEANALAKALGQDQPLIAMRSLAGLYQGKAPPVSMDRQVTERYIQILLNRRVPQRVVVGGNCQSVPFALQVANALAIAGYGPSSLIALDKMLPVPYGGRMLLLFGKDSRGHNPEFEFRNPTGAWGKYLADAHFGTVAGGHGAYFQPQNVTSLARALRDEIDLSADVARLPMRARQLQLTANVSKNSDREISVRLFNPNEVMLKCGAGNGISLTIHALKADDGLKRPLRLPSLSCPLMQDIPAGETIDMTVTLPADIYETGTFWVGVCEDGVGWFDLIEGSSPLARL